MPANESETNREYGVERRLNVRLSRQYFSCDCNSIPNFECAIRITWHNIVTSMNANLGIRTQNHYLNNQMYFGCINSNSALSLTMAQCLWPFSLHGIRA